MRAPAAEKSLLDFFQAWHARSKERTNGLLLPNKKQSIIHHPIFSACRFRLSPATGGARDKWWKRHHDSDFFSELGYSGRPGHDVVRDGPKLRYMH